MKRTTSPLPRVRIPTRPGFEPAIADLADPVCAKSCGRCHSCLRAREGEEYFLKGEYPKVKR